MPYVSTYTLYVPQTLEIVSMMFSSTGSINKQANKTLSKLCIDGMLDYKKQGAREVEDLRHNPNSLRLQAFIGDSTLNFGPARYQSRDRGVELERECVDVISLPPDLVHRAEKWPEEQPMRQNYDNKVPLLKMII